MPSNIFAIQPREINFRTQTNADWLDALVVWQSAQGGVLAGAQNAGNGALIVNAIAPQAAIGHHIVSISSLDGIPRITVQAPDGTVTGAGVVGLPLLAGNISVTLTSGSVPFAIGDTFAVEVLQGPVDITGLTFTLQVRTSRNSANVVLSASSAPSDGSTPTILVGSAGGQVAIRKLQPSMQRSVFAPGAYVYDILAADPVASRIVQAFFGTIEHVDGVTHLA